MKVRSVANLLRALTVNPFLSESQREWMHANHPEMAKRWEEHTPKRKKLPEHVHNRAPRKLRGKLDPTRTTALRKAFARQLRRAFTALKVRIVRKVMHEDAFGLKERVPLAFNSFCPTGPGGGVDASCSPLMHGTSVKAARSIKKEGLRIDKSAGTWHQKVVFTTTNLDTAKAYGMGERDKGQYAIVHLRPGVEIGGSDLGGGVAVFHKDIPASDIAKVEIYSFKSQEHALSSHKLVKTLNEVQTYLAIQLDDDDETIDNAFCPTGPGGGTDATCSPGGGSVGHVMKALASLPSKVIARIKESAKAKYAKLEARYGSRYAKAIIGAAMVGLPIPMPGAMVAVAAPVLAIAEMHRYISGGTHNEELDQDVIDEAVAELLVELDEELVGNVSYFATCERDALGHCAAGTGETVECGKDIKLAAKMLAKGAHVTLDQPDQVSTLIAKMQKMLDKAVEKGKDAPKFDLCKVSVSGANLFCQDNIGVPRVQMPQMRGLPMEGSTAAGLPKNKEGRVDVGKMFVQHVKDNGIAVEQVDIRASHLRASQNEIDGARIAELVTTKSKDDLRKRPIFVTKDNYVVDGHHHWAALVAKGGEKDLKVPVYRLNTDIGTALKMANDYAKQVGIKPKSVATANVDNADWEFHTSPAKVEEFQKWLAQQYKDTISGSDSEALWDRYIREGYRKGAGRSFDDVKAMERARGDKSADFYKGGKEQFLRSSFGRPETVEKAQLLAGRAFDDLEDVSDRMSTLMSRHLVDGLVEGKNPREIAKGMADEVDIGRGRAELIARTEIIRAHAEGQLDSMVALGVTQVGAQVEFSTAGDDGVCPECGDLEGDIYDVEDARGIIPVHPNCRCAWIPAIPEPDDELAGNLARNAFCPTGPGGGVDPTCSPGAGEAGRAIASEPKTAPPPTSPGHPVHDPDVELDSTGDGVTDAARVGVPAHEIPPPPSIGRLPNLTPHEREVEEGFIRAYESDPNGTAAAYRELIERTTKPGEPPTFGTDDAKALSPHWSAEDLQERSQNRATLNLALHQTANAIAKRAFVQELDKLNPGDEIMVTVGGCGAGKGYALKNVPQALEAKGRSKVVWDSAGDQNATENPWIQKEAQSRGLKVNYVFVHADPETQWAHPERGVVKRAGDPNDGRMVDAQVFADSYALGARNHQAFHVANRDNPHANFMFLENSGTPKLLTGIPEAALKIDRTKLAKFATTAVRKTDAPPHVKRGALMGERIWSGNA